MPRKDQLIWSEIIFSEIKQEIMYLLAIHLTEIFSYNHQFLSH